LDVDRVLFAESTGLASPSAAAQALIPYIERELAGGTRLGAITRHVLGLFRGVPGARNLRRYLATEAVKPGAGIGTYRAALAMVGDSEARLTRIAAE